MRPAAVLDRAPYVLAAVMGGVGSLHFVATDLLEATVPRWVPAKRAVIYGSGALEMVCAYGLARRRRWAGPLASAVLLVIWTANIQMALDAGSGRNSGILDNRLAMWGRVPLQIPMMWIAWRSSRSP
ncbi:MAG: DoxX family protein [Acidimicrobiia bacterium]